METLFKRVAASICEGRVQEDHCQSCLARVEKNQTFVLSFLEKISLLLQLNSEECRLSDVQACAGLGYVLRLLEAVNVEETIHSADFRSVFQPWYRLVLSSLSSHHRGLQEAVVQILPRLLPGEIGRLEYLVHTCALAPFRLTPLQDSLVFRVLAKHAESHGKEFLDVAHRFMKSENIALQSGVLTMVGHMLQQEEFDVGNVLDSDFLKSLLVRLGKQEEDVVSFTVALWVLVILLPSLSQTLSSLRETLQEILWRALQLTSVSCPSLSRSAERARAFGNAGDKRKIDRDLAEKKIEKEDHGKASLETESVREEGEGGLYLLSHEEELSSTVQKYVVHLYAVFPRSTLHTLQRFHAASITLPVQPNPKCLSLSEALVKDLRFHPGLLSPQDEEGEKPQRTSAESIQSALEELVISSPSVATLPLLPSFSPRQAGEEKETEGKTLEREASFMDQIFQQCRGLSLAMTFSDGRKESFAPSSVESPLALPPESVALLIQRLLLLSNELAYERYIVQDCWRQLRQRNRHERARESLEHENKALREELARQQQHAKKLKAAANRQRDELNAFEEQQRRWQHEVQDKLSLLSSNLSSLQKEGVVLKGDAEAAQRRSMSLEQQLGAALGHGQQLLAALKGRGAEERKLKECQQQVQELTRELFAWEAHHRLYIESSASCKLQDKDELIRVLTQKLKEREDEDGARALTRVLIPPQLPASAQTSSALKSYERDTAEKEAKDTIPSKLDETAQEVGRDESPASISSTMSLSMRQLAPSSEGGEYSGRDDVDLQLREGVPGVPGTDTVDQSSALSSFRTKKVRGLGLGAGLGISVTVDAAPQPVVTPLSSSAARRSGQSFKKSSGMDRVLQVSPSIVSLDNRLRDDPSSVSQIAELETTVANQRETINRLHDLLHRHQMASEEDAKVAAARYRELRNFNKALENRILQLVNERIATGIFPSTRPSSLSYSSQTSVGDKTVSEKGIGTMKRSDDEEDNLLPPSLRPALELDPSSSGRGPIDRLQGMLNGIIPSRRGRGVVERELTGIEGEYEAPGDTETKEGKR